MDPIQLLHSDHQKFLALFSQIETTTIDSIEERLELHLRLELLLALHMLSEERIFYKPLLTLPEITDMIKKNYEAHHAINIAIHELKITPYQSEHWLPKFQAIRDTMLSDMAEKENFLFPKLREILSQAQLLAIGEKMAAYRQTLIHSNNNTES
ncbi:MAG: hemerythrin [Gammaproteobacteria bacterium]|jgi:hypothetical protein|nr:hemerythrin [Gammaproteobacteria bacterium]